MLRVSRALLTSRSLSCERAAALSRVSASPSRINGLSPAPFPALTLRPITTTRQSIMHPNELAIRERKKSDKKGGKGPFSVSFSKLFSFGFLRRKPLELKAQCSRFCASNDCHVPSQTADIALLFIAELVRPKFSPFSPLLTEFIFRHRWKESKQRR